MQRGAAFAVLPLAEAVRALVPAPAAAVLLRAMTLFLRGLCDGHADRTDTEDADDGDGPHAAVEPIVAARSDAQVPPSAPVPGSCNTQQRNNGTAHSEGRLKPVSHTRPAPATGTGDS